MSLPMTRSAPRSLLPDPTYDAAYFDGVLPKRLFAWVIDVVLILAAMVVLNIFTAGVFLLLWLPMQAAVSFLYRWFTLKARSATLGMRVMSLELRGPSGAPLTSVEALLHTASYLVGATIVVLQLVSVAMMIGRPLGRSLPDEIVGSVMINRPT